MLHIMRRKGVEQRMCVCAVVNGCVLVCVTCVPQYHAGWRALDTAEHMRWGVHVEEAQYGAASGLARCWRGGRQRARG